MGRLFQALRMTRPSRADLRLWRLLLDRRLFSSSPVVPWRRVIQAQALAAYMRQTRPDLVHVHFGQNAMSPMALIKSGVVPQAKLLVTFHGYDLHDYPPRMYEELFRFADHFTVNSEYTRRVAVEMGCPETRTSKLPMPIDVSQFRPASRERNRNDELRVLFVGRLVDFKAPELAVEAIARFTTQTRHPVHLDIIGDGKRAPVVREAIERHGLRKFVTLHGARSQDEVVQAMQRASVFLFPGIVAPDGRQENQGVVVQEAQAMELPVIVSDAGGVSEGIVDGETGFVVAEGDTETMAERLALLAEDHVLRRDMGARGRRFVAEYYDVQVIGDRLDTLYTHLLT